MESLLQVENLTKSYGDRLLFGDITFGVNEGDKIGIYVTDYTKDAPAALQVSGNRANNEGVVYNGDKWVAERSIYWGEGKSDIYAYYPYINNVTDVDEFPFSIATDQDAEGAYEASDLLWAKAEYVSEALF